MSNPHRGEVSFRADGRDWTLRYSTNALCELEDDLGLGTNEIVERLQQGADLRMVRSVFRAGLGNGTTKEQAGILIDDLGFARASELVGEAFAAAFPEPEEGESRPPKGGKAGNGKRS